MKKPVIRALIILMGIMLAFLVLRSWDEPNEVPFRIELSPEINEAEYPLNEGKG